MLKIFNIRSLAFDRLPRKTKTFSCERNPSDLLGKRLIYKRHQRNNGVIRWAKRMWELKKMVASLCLFSVAEHSSFIACMSECGNKTHETVRSYTKSRTFSHFVTRRRTHLCCQDS